ncbi:MAG: OB-fold nucleic acid binding domain-containing protein [Candidatus Bathyarchaeota archaeon]
MQTKEKIVDKILETRPDLSRENVEKMIVSKKNDIGKLLTEEGAAYMVANDLGIDLSGEKPLKTQITIKDIVVGASDLTITCQVLTIYPSRSFNRSNGVEGKVSRIVLGDDTGKITAVLWDEKADLAQSRFSQGDIIRINHGYVRGGLDGRPELNVGRKGSIVILPKDLRPEISCVSETVSVKVHDVREGETVNFVGFVEKVSSISTFKRSDGEEGKVERIKLSDETGSIMAVFWDEQIDLISNIQRGDTLTIQNGYIKKGFGENLEIHIRKESAVSFLRRETTKGHNLSTISYTPLEKLTPQMPDVDVLGRVAEIGSIKEFLRQSGEKGKVGELFLIDNSGSVRLSVWDEKTEILKTISKGDILLVQGAYTREGFRGGLQLSLGKMGTLTVNPDIAAAKDFSASLNKFTNIAELKVGFLASIKGKISEPPLIKTVTTRDGREIKVASLRIRDDTGEIRASFWGDLADRFEGVKLETEIIVNQAYVKPGFAEDLEISSRTTTEIEIQLNTEKEPNPNLLRARAVPRKDETNQKVSMLKEEDKAHI